MAITDLRIFFACVTLACAKSFLLSPLFDDMKYKQCFDFVAHDRTQDSIAVI